MKIAGNFGIGVDIEKIARFRNLRRESDGAFLNRIFTPNELDYCFSKTAPGPHLAARFSGKEAILKALSYLTRRMPESNEIEILNEERGKPNASINNNNFKNIQIFLSFSHCEDAAIAFSIVMEVENER